MLTDELSILALYGLLVAVTLFMQVTGAANQLGMGYLMSTRDESRSLSGITGRVERAKRNSITAFVLFAPPILILALRDNFTAHSLLAAQAFLLARLVYLPAYALGIKVVRTLAWIAGFAATVILYFLAL